MVTLYFIKVPSEMIHTSKNSLIFFNVIQLISLLVFYVMGQHK